MDSVEPGIDTTYFVVHYFVTKYRCYCAGVFAKSVDSIIVMILTLVTVIVMRDRIGMIMTQ